MNRDTPRSAQPAPSPAARTIPATATGNALEDGLPQSPLHCRLRITPSASMCAAILAGLAMLQREGRVRLELELLPAAPPRDHGPWHLRDKERPQAVLEVDGGGSAVIDPHDGHELETDDLARHDLYFKRSLTPESLLFPDGAKLRPLPPLNDVRTDFPHLAELRSELGVTRSVGRKALVLSRWVAQVYAARLGLGGRTNLSRMQAPPVARQPQRVLAMTGLWDPDALPADAVALRAEREAMNRQRVECIRALRRAFGARFHGGVRPDAFSIRHAPDVVLPTARHGSRREFLRRVQEHAVCVTSAGLLGSNGFRLAEFVAFSRAIVSEPLRYLVAGDFRADHHYLTYTTPEECVARVAWLFDRPEQREAMARRNWDYYTQWQSPDRLALRLLSMTWAARRPGEPAIPREHDRGARIEVAEAAPTRVAS